jgi:3',5'-cyclic AMP phosphodiesterase CpdA
MRIAHFSDVHVQLPDWRTRPLRELGPLRALATIELWKGRGRLYDEAAARLAGLAAEVQRLGFDHAVCTGDLTQLGHPEEFALARRSLGPLASDAARFTALPGNHDRYPFRMGEQLFERHFPEQERSDLPGPLRVRLLGEQVALIVLPTAARVSWPVLAQGRAGREALRALPALLARPEVRSRCALVLVHHAPLLPDGRPDWPWHGLRDGRELMRLCAAGGVQAVLCGHVHERYDLPAAPGRVRVLCAGSSTEAGREGYWDLRIEGTRLQAAAQRAIGAAP